mmetsp:Transcript_21594/g.50948  ORF Transcript_21594/g.50948 Transcript_21594/m.50948 type:complete len:233 (-) Transcript_21594:28-726(-)
MSGFISRVAFDHLEDSRLVQVGQIIGKLIVHRIKKLHLGHEPIRSRSNGRVLGMILTDATTGMCLQLDGLTWSQLGQQDIIMDHMYTPRELILLCTLRNKLERSAVDMLCIRTARHLDGIGMSLPPRLVLRRVMRLGSLRCGLVEIVVAHDGVLRIGRGIPVALALSLLFGLAGTLLLLVVGTAPAAAHLETEHQSVFVGQLIFVLHVDEQSRIDIDRDQAQPMGQNLIVND